MPLRATLYTNNDAGPAQQSSITKATTQQQGDSLHHLASEQEGFQRGMDMVADTRAQGRDVRAVLIRST